MVSSEAHPGPPVNQITNGSFVLFRDLNNQKKYEIPRQKYRI